MSVQTSKDFYLQMALMEMRMTELLYSFQQVRYRMRSKRNCHWSLDGYVEEEVGHYPIGCKGWSLKEVRKFMKVAALFFFPCHAQLDQGAFSMDVSARIVTRSLFRAILDTLGYRSFSKTCPCHLISGHAPDLSISKTAHLLGFSHTAISRVYREQSNKEKNSFLMSMENLCF